MLKVQKNPSDATNKRNSELIFPTNIGSRKHAVFTTLTGIHSPVAAEGRFKVLLRFLNTNSNPAANVSIAHPIETMETDMRRSHRHVSVCAGAVSL